MIYITKNNEGYWINFKSATGKQCALHIASKLLNGGKGIFDQAILETCEQDCVVDYSSKKECKNCKLFTIDVVEHLGEMEHCNVIFVENDKKHSMNPKLLNKNGDCKYHCPKEGR